MAESDIYSDPNRLLSLAEDLRVFVSRLIAEMAKMSDGLRQLGGTWQDDEYRKFLTVQQRLEQDLRTLGEEITKREPELNEDAQLLRAYLHKSAP